MDMLYIAGPGHGGPALVADTYLEGRELMNKIKHSRHEHEGPDSDSVNHGFHRPYWKHAHHDWRLWVAVSLMLVALLTYVMSDDLAWRPRSQPQQPLSGTLGK